MTREPDVGDTFGRYELRSRLGQGGMGTVYRAFDTGHGRTVALKLLLPSLAQDPAFRERFDRESHIAAREDDQLGTIEESVIVRAERRFDHASIGDSHGIHCRLEDSVELGTITVGGADVRRGQRCVLDQRFEGGFEQQFVATLPEQQLTVRQQIERSGLWRRHFG